MSILLKCKCGNERFFSNDYAPVNTTSGDGYFVCDTCKTLKKIDRLKREDYYHKTGKTVKL